MKKIFVLPDVLIKCMLCLVGIVALNMAHSLGEELPALYGLETGGEVILIIPCMGWSLFISLPLAHYAARLRISSMSITSCTLWARFNPRSGYGSGEPALLISVTDRSPSQLR